MCSSDLDWHDDSSVHEAAAYIGRRRAPTDGWCGSDDLYEYAAWQRAAQTAINDGRDDWHDWAGRHATEFAITRPEDVTATRR